jgi:hypothetical protein
MASSSDRASIGRAAFATLRQLHNTVSTSSKSLTPIQTIPRMTQERLEDPSAKTILYLAYGSNLSAETFKGARGIVPISAVNAHIPSLSLTFDLSGIPYTEPCFANTKYRDPSTDVPKHGEYHKDRWHKGLIGVVYEVTPEDYRTIIATEGGGASYQDVVVPCYTLPSGGTIVDPHPSGTPFNAHTLLQPRHEPEESKERRIVKTADGRLPRPDPSYAQPSARYLKLITDGAEEHSLPSEYMAFLYNIRPYTITTQKQKLGQALILAVWFPIIMSLFGLGKTLADEDGKIPEWLANLLGLVFNALWLGYDQFFKDIFGDGERTMKKKDGEDLDAERGWGSWVDEKSELAKLQQV